MAARALRAHAHTAAVTSFGGLDGANEAALMLSRSVVVRTADNYERAWRRLER